MMFYTVLLIAVILLILQSRAYADWVFMFFRRTIVNAFQLLVRLLQDGHRAATLLDQEASVHRAVRYLGTGLRLALSTILGGALICCYQAFRYLMVTPDHVSAYLLACWPTRIEETLQPEAPWADDVCAGVKGDGQPCSRRRKGLERDLEAGPWYCWQHKGQRVKREGDAKGRPVERTTLARRLWRGEW